MAVLKSGIPYTILRPVTVYGHGEMANKARIFSYIMRNKLKIIGNGLNFISLIYIDDLIECILLAAYNDLAMNQTYIVSNEPCHIKDLFNIIADELGVRRPKHFPVSLAYVAAVFFEMLNKITGLEPLLTREKVRNLTASFSYDTIKTRNDLGFVPKTTLKEGVRKSAWWYRDQGLFYVPYLKPLKE